MVSNDDGHWTHFEERKNNVLVVVGEALIWSREGAPKDDSRVTEKYVNMLHALDMSNRTLCPTVLFDLRVPEPERDVAIFWGGYEGKGTCN